MTFDDSEGDEGYAINPAGFVAQGVSQGLSGRQIISLLRDNGVRIANQTAYRLIGEVREAIANRETIQGLPTDRLPTGGEYAWWVTNRRGFSTQVLVLTRDRATGLIGSTVSSYTTRDAHTIDEALQNKLADWEDLTGAEGEYEDQQLLGMLPWNIFQMGPEE